MDRRESAALNRESAALTLTMSADLLSSDSAPAAARVRAATRVPAAFRVRAAARVPAAARASALAIDAISAPRNRPDQDPGEHRENAGDLRRRGGVAKREPADDGSNEGLEVDKRPGHVGGDSGLSEREEPERQQRPHQR
jgi:hypothetical protein